MHDLLIQNARIDASGDTVDIGVRDGLIVEIGRHLACEAAQHADAEGRFACAGFVESHIHLDKTHILDRCIIGEGTLAEAVRQSARAKAAFTQEDVYRRAAGVVEAAIMQGTNRMRTFVEVDAAAGLRSFEAIKQVKIDYAFAIDIDICAFAQDGLTQAPETVALIEAALGDGADMVGGCPYTDVDPARHIETIFDIAERHGVPVDFHLDFQLDPERTDLPPVIAATQARGYGGRVSVAHVTNLSAASPRQVGETADKLAHAGIAVTVLPATDLFLNGRDHDRLVPRGVAPAHSLASRGVVVSVASNNICNPFTPYGDASLLRMANLYANVAQLSRGADLTSVFAMITSGAARLLGAPYGKGGALAIGAPADIVVVDALSAPDAVACIARPIRGWKRGRQTFENGRPRMRCR